MAKDKTERIGLKFLKTMFEINNERRALRTDNKDLSIARLSDGIVTDPEFPRIFDRMVKTKRKEQLR